MAISKIVQNSIDTPVVNTGPAFAVYRSSSQNVSTNTWTKVQFNAEDFDTASCFDSTTNYRFTPNVAGYYQFNANIYFTGGSLSSVYYNQIYKNGTASGRYSLINLGSSNLADCSAVVSALIYMNGTTDYIEIYGYNNAGTGPAFYGGTNGPTHFSGVLVRAV